MSTVTLIASPAYPDHFCSSKGRNQAKLVVTEPMKSRTLRLDTRDPPANQFAAGRLRTDCQSAQIVATAVDNIAVTGWSWFDIDDSQCAAAGSISGPRRFSVGYQNRVIPFGHYTPHPVQTVDFCLQTSTVGQGGTQIMAGHGRLSAG